jgi:hypothetical protein
MSTRAKHAATTPIPVQLSAPQFNEFILPHLSMPKRGPKGKLSYQAFLEKWRNNATCCIISLMESPRLCHICCSWTAVCV